MSFWIYLQNRWTNTMLSQTNVKINKRTAILLAFHFNSNSETCLSTMRYMNIIQIPGLKLGAAVLIDRTLSRWVII